MSIQERSKELATLRAVGLKRRELQWLIVLEAVIISLMAAAASFILATPLVIYLQNVGIDIASSLPEGLPVPFGERFRTNYQPVHFFLSVVLGTVTATAGAIIPARRAAKSSIASVLGGGI